MKKIMILLIHKVEKGSVNMSKLDRNISIIFDTKVDTESTMGGVGI